MKARTLIGHQGERAHKKGAKVLVALGGALRDLGHLPSVPGRRVNPAATVPGQPGLTAVIHRKVSPPMAR